ncbi:MAG: insulinase family protein [Acidaminococcales bacterium]|jgi:predicted Zn-dependent peptidase|nr:insulinase family protein [Acidaminococcales bacterium]
MIQQTIMPNGIRVVTDSMHEVRSASLGFWVACGARQDTVCGTAHFIEHMFFKGTERRDARQLALEADRIGGQLNAFTAAEYTCYYARALDSHIEQLFDLLADMFLHSRFLPGDVKKEKQVIMQEYDMYYDDPEELAQNEFFSFVWGDHPLGRNVTGDKKDVRKINGRILANFLHDFYTPDNLVVAAAGNVRHGDICGLADKYLSGLSGQAKKIPASAPDFAAGRKFIPKDLEQSQIIWGVPGIPLADCSWHAASILCNRLGGSASSRLFQEIRETKGLAYFIDSVFSSYSDAGLFTINAAVNPEKGEFFLAALEEIMGEVAENGLTENELQDSKEQLISSLLLGLENSGGRMQRVGKLSVLGKPLIPTEELIAKIKGASLTDVAAMAARLFKGIRPAIVGLGPKCSGKALHHAGTRF